MCNAFLHMVVDFLLGESLRLCRHEAISIDLHSFLPNRLLFLVAVHAHSCDGFCDTDSNG